MIKAIIADDEIHARERLRDLLARFNLFAIVAEAGDGNEALHMIITHNPDVAFLDINMPGISVFQSIPSLQKQPLIVFQTAYSEHAAKAFEIEALDYLLKPIKFERLERTVQKIQEKLALITHETLKDNELAQDSFDRITVKISGRIKIIENKDIIKISFENGFCYIYTQTEKFISDKYLNHYEQRLEKCGFFRASRTELVNLTAISAIQSHYQAGYTIELNNGLTVDLSRRKAQALKRIIDF